MRRNCSRQENLMALAFYLCPPLPGRTGTTAMQRPSFLPGEIERSGSATCLKIANLKACDPNRTGLGFANAARMGRQVTSEYLTEPDKTMSEAMPYPRRCGSASRSESESPTLRDRGLGFFSSRQPAAARAGTRRAGSHARQSGLLPQRASFQLRGHLLPHGHRHPRPAHGKPYQTVGGGNTERATHIVERHFAQCAARPSLRPQPHHARRPLPRRVVSSRVLHTPTDDQWLYAFDGRKIALPSSDESTWPSLNFIHYHDDCVFERYTWSRSSRKRKL